MDAREYLGQIKVLKQHIKAKQVLLAEMKEQAICGGGPGTDQERVKTSITGGAMERSVIDYVDFEQEIREDIYKYLRKKNEIIDTITSLNDSRYIKVIFAKWVDGDSLERIAVETNYHFGHVKKLYWQGMKEIQKILDEEV